MKLKFESNLPYQQEAIASVTELFSCSRDRQVMGRTRPWTSAGVVAACGMSWGSAIPASSLVRSC